MPLLPFLSNIKLDEMSNTCPFNTHNFIYDTIMRKFTTGVHFFPTVSALQPPTCSDNKRNSIYSRTFVDNFAPSFFPVVHAAEGTLTMEDYAAQRKQQLYDTLRGGTGMDRIKRMYSFDDYNQPSPELRYIIKGTTFVYFITAISGAIRSLSRTRDDFMRKNLSTAFESEYIARRKLTDRMTLSAMYGGFSNGLKYGSFTGIYLIVTLTAANYNNKSTIYEHIAAGALFGAVYRIKFGLKGMVVSSGLGAVIGLFAGGAILSFMWLAGVNYEDMRVWQHEYFGIQLEPKEALATAPLSENIS